ncbi:peptidoglycan-binding domain-containing protein [Streptomyces albicerus]|uniref:peptidoglycan-binding domain-containing protein n=1 Tax=Streptomyces albicerus TaxID=2569859 RepID=UPI00124B34E5|nr:peptidoglycan-binding domain-containing protein [Streptomyces albicerus]
MAAPTPAQQQAVTGEVGTLAVVNLGLNTTRAKHWQCFMQEIGYYSGPIDGQLGTNSWKAAQEMFNDLGLGAGTVDGIVGPNTISALQKYLNRYASAGLTITGIAGPKTQDAFWDFNVTNFC